MKPPAAAAGPAAAGSPEDAAAAVARPGPESACGTRRAATALFKSMKPFLPFLGKPALDVPPTAPAPAPASSAHVPAPSGYCSPFPLPAALAAAAAARPACDIGGTELKEERRCAGPNAGPQSRMRLSRTRNGRCMARCVIAWGWAGGGAGAGVGGGAPTLLLLSAIPSLTPIRADNSHLLALTTHDT